MATEPSGRMSQVDATAEAIDDITDGKGTAMASTGREYLSKAAPYARRSIGSGALAGISGSVMLVRGVRALRRGQRGRGLVRLLLGGLLVAGAVAQRRSGDDVDQTDVVDTAPDVETAATETSTTDDEPASGDEASAVVDTSADIEDAGADSGPELDSDVESTDVDQTDVVETGLDEAELDDASDSDTEENEATEENDVQSEEATEEDDMQNEEATEDNDAQSEEAR